MGLRKGKYYKRKCEATGKRSSKIRKEDLVVDINGEQVKILDKYIDFLRTLDQKENFIRYANRIKQKSAQWNEIRRKHLTASQITRICQWLKKDPYIFDNISKYISDKKKSRLI